MTSSSAILYPSMKGLESNSSFVQVSPPVKDMNTNLSLHYRHSASTAERGSTKLKSKQNECVERKGEYFNNRRQHGEYSSNIERRVAKEKEVDGYDNVIERSNRSTKIPKADVNPKPKIEKSQQYDVRELEVNADVAKSSDYGDELSLATPESFQNLVQKHPKHTIIINNTFINRPTAEQDEFLTKFSPTFYKNNPKVESVSDVLPLVTERICHNAFESITENGQDAIPDQETHTDIQTKDCTDIDESTIVNELNSQSITGDKNIPLGSIITAILWIILILFWFLLYLKVLKVYNPLPKALPKPEPTNYELCLMIFKRFGIAIGKWLKF